MNIAIATLHCTDNPGSSLQSFALEQFLLAHGYNATILDYRPCYLLNNGRPLRTLAKKILMYKAAKTKRELYAAFERDYLKLTDKTFRTYKQLCKDVPYADWYITGSDQVWNCSYKCGRDPAFYLDFAKKGKKLAYAVSLGREQIPEEDLDFMRPYISDFSAISTREKSACRTLEKIYHSNVEYVCDPTLLMERNVYDKMAIEPKEKNYCVVYLAEKSELLNDVVAWVREKYGLKIIQLTGAEDQCKYDEKKFSVGPREWLGYIKNASFVISGSFHATVFSTIYHRDFAVLLPRKNQARIREFLTEAGMPEKIVESSAQLSAYMSPDYTDVDKRIEAFCKHSEDFFLSCLSKSK